jgi:hypothetical protein
MKKTVFALLAALTLGDVALPAFAADGPVLGDSGTPVLLAARHKKKKKSARHHRGKPAAKKKAPPVQL